METILGHPLNQNWSLPDIIGYVARHYLERAMPQTHGNKSEAARVLGLGSYQALNNWLQKYVVNSWHSEYAYLQAIAKKFVLRKEDGFN